MKYFFCFLLFSFSVNAQTMSSIYFKHNSAELNAVSKQKLDSISRLKSKFKLKIYGNCDTSGNIELNQKLSEKRVLAVSNYLKNRLSDNLKIVEEKGFGDQKPINDNSVEELRAKNRRVDVFIEKVFMPHEKILRKTPPSFVKTSIEMMKVKDTFLLPTVHFIGGRSVWLPEGKTELQKVLTVLKNNPTIKIELQGHICCDYENFDGEDLDLKTYNLSFTRADAIRQYLLKAGIDGNRVVAKGFGHLNPLVYPEKTEADFAKNRRVEIVILEK
ncbi:hypothetical protein ASG01_03475 [Chryseobacterium sp. Leaf180]|uniref:OmpA family protein n=1 Tax=Chryseobacterium sp. Leaf180 TaxID=1736289 RepID=UPI0006FA0C02|nr:OmpA family protein [Chryseobacterium sp. Leaf180]KQR94937.1 hypothetical protein ASG01_03475 [Chryseobacterium sp. Leaf180]